MEHKMEQLGHEFRLDFMSYGLVACSWSLCIDSIDSSGSPQLISWSLASGAESPTPRALHHHHTAHCALYQMYHTDGPPRSTCS
jgi:hypothetical protein